MPKNATRQALAREAKSAAARSSMKTKKQKLTPEQRSQIAKDRWEKIRANKQPKIVDVPGTNGVMAHVVDGVITGVTITSPNATILPVAVEGDTFQASTSPAPTPEQPPVAPESVIPAPVEAPVAPKKQKRYTGPKEFSVALKAAETRLAKAIVERAQKSGELAALNAEIPSLLGIINALKGSGNLAPPVPYDLSIASYDPATGLPQAQGFQVPSVQPQGPMNLQAIMQAAQVTPPAFKSTGGAVQFAPDVVGTLEGPDDDDPERFITGEHAGRGWIGG